MKNPFPPRDPPKFIPYKKDDLYRGLAIWRGHEYIVINKSDLEPGDGLREGDFGVASDKWVFAIRDSKHVAVAQVSSNALNGRLFHTPEIVRARVAEIYHNGKQGPQDLRAAIDFCTSYPTSEESIRSGSVGVECSFQVSGSHFYGESLILQGDPIVLGLDTIFMEGPPVWWTSMDEDVVRENLFSFSDIWEKLELWFLEQRNKSNRAAFELPKQCTHCRGSGVVPR